MRQVHLDYLDALKEIHKLQAKLDCSSKQHERLRDRIDTLYPQLTQSEQEDAYWFSLALDRPEGVDGCP